MKITLSLTLYAILLLAFFSSCTTSHAVFNSPLNGNMSDYHAMPTRADEHKSGTYVGGGLNIGGANDALRDNVVTLKASLHEAHAAGAFRFNYGGSLSIGSYNISESGYTYYNDRADSIIRGNSGSHYWGSYGVFAGVAVAVPMGHRGEWRCIGIEGNYAREFGEYYDFRSKVPDSIFRINDRHQYLGTLGLTTEWINKRRRGTEFGVKLGLGTSFRRLYYYNRQPPASGNFGDNNSREDLIYFNNTFHITSRRNTYYIQYTVAERAAFFQIGLNYRL